MSMKCSSCGSDDIDYDPARGVAACESCGTVLEQNLIVNEVTFAEDARGRSNLVGQHVRADGRISSFGVLPGFSREATEITMSNGRRHITQMVSSLGLKTRHTDFALRLFRLAVERNFHKGRRMGNVCCACLYIVCRTEKTPHMLIDFSDQLETNVYVLGHTFLKLAQLLSVDLPIVDPSLYIHRFASKLEFADKAHAVAMSALRLMARMQRDWMNDGRRPSGICGAALAVASRMHDFYRSIADIARVVRVGNVSLRERLKELNKTPTAAMTTAQIEAGGGDDGKATSLAPSERIESCDPPAFQRSQAKKSDLSKDGAEAEKETGDVDVRTQSSRSIKFAVEKGVRTAEDSQLESELQQALASAELQELDKEGDVCEAFDAAVAAPAHKNGGESAMDIKQRQEQEDKIAENEQDTTEKETVDEDDELSDLDDDEARDYINSEVEYEAKKRLWTEINKEYLEKQERLEEMKRERPEEYKRLRPWRSQKKKKVDPAAKDAKGAEDRDAPPTPPPPPKPSKKLNYSVLESLGRSGGLGLADNSGPAAPTGDLPPLPPRQAKT